MKGMANDAANGDNMDFPKLFDDEMIDELLANKDNSLAPRIRTLEELLSELSVSFSRIAKRLTLLVGTSEFDVELTKLIIDDRGGRQGFPPDVLGILLQLSLRHTEKYGKLNPETDTWNSVPIK
jgi:hypothetical protein